ncbi:CRISPR-associated helicase Cas3' [Enterococcus sp. UD-01]|jgi:CRISPR-associated endonuclease/helicase Cas3|uniref:CRISPR-associated helicase Cas3' n=1 Tax=Enterococcus sp. UD-01 TaxID=3373911 RepID=UPI003837DDF5
MYIAHVRKKDGEHQLLKDHLMQSADLSGNWDKKLGLEKTCYLAGLLHDLGKYSDEFQSYLRQAVIDPSSVARGSVDHSTAGGKLMYDYCHTSINSGIQQLLAEIVGNAIISHHSGKGLRDYLTAEGDIRSIYLERVTEKQLEDYEGIKKRFFTDCYSEKMFKQLLVEAENELQKFYIKNNMPQVTPHETFFIIKFVYSCLLDADRTNTMLFEEGKFYEKKDHLQLFKQYSNRLEEKMLSFQNNKSNNKINQLRQEMSNQCKAFSKKETGIYSLSIPTGGGKTFGSLRFAINHAIKHKKERIIYVIPFTNIIEQNSLEVREVLKDDINILEHHSNIFTESEEMDEMKMTEKEREEIEYKQALMRDNWDAPIIFTTMVQFLETIYSGGTRKPRRFHNLTNAVIIFDEAQGVPTKCTYMFNEVLNFLKKHGQTTSVLCTATQPSLDYVKRALEKEPDGEIVSCLDEVEEAFRRVELIDVNSDKQYSLEELGDFCQTILKEKENLLVILNTKSAVLKLYQIMEEQERKEVELFHLSTAMCPKHRKDTLKEIREKLDAGKRVVCLTTQLIEAGVDISFQAVVRSVAGLDSIAQAAGRCNRHGEQARGEVYLLNLSPELENLDHLKEIKKGKEITLILLRKYKEESAISDRNLLSNKVQHEYFIKYYTAFEKVLKYPTYEFDQKAVKPGVNLHLWDLLGENLDGQEAYSQNEDNPKLICSCSPETVAKYFNVIHSPTTSVLVPYKKGEELIGDLNGNLKPEQIYPILKRAQQYAVNLFDYELEKLQKNGTIYPLLNGEVYAVTDNSYSDNFGIDFTSLAPSEAIMF